MSRHGVECNAMQFLKFDFPALFSRVPIIDERYWVEILICEKCPYQWNNTPTDLHGYIFIKNTCNQCIANQWSWSQTLNFFHVNRQIDMLINKFTHRTYIDTKKFQRFYSTLHFMYKEKISICYERYLSPDKCILFFWFYRKNKSLQMWQNPWNKRNCGENMINKT